MAVLQKMRDKMAVLITVVIALALLAFILTDLLGSGSSLFSDRETVGVIDGQKIKIQDYQDRITRAEEFAKMNSQTGTISEEQQNQLRESEWQSLVREITFGKLYENAGIAVQGKEVYDMVVGDHIAPMLRQIFVNSNGIYDKARAEYFLQNKSGDPRANMFWSNIEETLVENRKMGKYMSLLRQGTYCTSAQMEAEKARRGANVDMNYVGIRYSLIPDSTVAVSESEINALYKENKNKGLYKVNETRDIEYVTFPVRPTQEDRDETRSALESLRADFEAAEGDEAIRFARLNSDEAEAQVFQSLTQLSSRLQQFVEGATAGQVYGPYRDGEMFKMTKLVAVAARPDSVKARHILIQDSKELADSLLEVAKKSGADFAALARQYSKDPGSAINGGDLGWFNDGVMVPEFNEACFTGKKGDIVLVTSQFGHHIINIQDLGKPSTKYKMATISKEVQYSSRTRQQVWSEANKKIENIKDAETFQAVVDTAHLVKRMGRNIYANQYSINSLKHAREIVKWAFEAKVGTVSELFQIDDEFVLAVLTNKQEKGEADLASVRPSIERELRNGKKAALIAKQVEGKSLSEVAALYDGKLHVDSVKNLSYAANTVTGAGVEPALVGKACTAEQGKVQGVVEGNNGAYVFEVVGKEENNLTDDQIRAAYAQQMSMIQYYLGQVVTDVEIDDRRIKFY